MRKRQDLEVTVASQRRRQILDAARACIAEEGAEKATLRKVAERAGFSHGTIAYYFKDKKELIDAALREMARSYMDALYHQEASPYGPDGPQALTNLVESFVQRNIDGAGFVVQILDAGLHNTELRDVHHEVLQYGWDLIENMVRAGIETGEFRHDLDPALAARLIHSVMIWWGFELGGAATSSDLAWQVGKLSVDLLRPQAAAPRSADPPPSRAPRAVPPSTLQVVRAAIFADEKLSQESAGMLLAAFESMYALVSGQGAANGTASEAKVQANGNGTE